MQSYAAIGVKRSYADLVPVVLSTAIELTVKFASRLQRHFDRGERQE